MMLVVQPEPPCHPPTSTASARGWVHMKHVHLQGWKSTGTIKLLEWTTQRENEVPGYPEQSLPPCHDSYNKASGNKLIRFLGCHT